jgi:type IV fimbrial biogenesis protein FimT
MKRSYGLTLIELMVTLAIFGILVGLAIPAFNTMTDGNRIVAEQRRMLSAINLARSEASHRNQTVTMASGAGGDWSQGIEIYSDADAGGNTAYNAGTDMMIKDLDASNTNITLNSDGAGDDGYISFQGNGMLNEAAGTVSIAICDSRGPASGRLITVNRVGRASVQNAVTCTP